MTHAESALQWMDMIVRQLHLGCRSFLLHGNIFDHFLNPAKQYSTPLIPLLMQRFALRQATLFVHFRVGVGFHCLKRGTGAELKDGTEDFKQLSGFSSQGANALAAAAGIQVDDKLPESPTRALPLIWQTLTGKRQEKEQVGEIVVAIENTQLIAPATSGAQLTMEDRQNIELLRAIATEREAANPSLIFLLAGNIAEVSSLLTSPASGIPAIYIPKPDFAAREAFFTQILKEHEQCMPSPQLARLTAGLSLRQLGDIIAEARRDFESISSDAISMIKKRVIAQEYGELLECIEPTYGFEALGGLAHVKAELLNVARALRGDIDPRYAPSGILLAGEPGTGKTAATIALAKEAGFNFLRFGQIRSMWYGQSESLQSRAFECIREMMPVVVFLDEFDETEGQSRSTTYSHEVSQRMRGRFLAEMSDPSLRGKVLWVAASNRPDLIDAAFKRPGRLELKIPFPPPTEKEIAEIFPAVCLQEQYPLAVNNFTPFAKRVNGYTGAEILAVMHTAYKHALLAGRGAITPSDVEFGIEDFIPARDEAEFRYMRKIALEECSSRSLRPENYQELLESTSDADGDASTNGHTISRLTRHFRN